MKLVQMKNSGMMVGTILITGALVATTPAMANNDVEYNRLDHGGVEIEFNNGCRVSFDRDGRRTDDRGGCKNKQLKRADDYADDYLDDHGSSHGSSHGGSSSNGIPEGQMSRYCVGEASAKLDTRPTNLHANDVLRDGSDYLVTGYEDGNNSTFECHFNRDGEFKKVVVHHYSHPSHNDGSHGSSSGNIPHSAKQRCRDQFGESNKVTTVSPLREGYWEVIMQANNSSRSVACTIQDDGTIEDWVELN